MSVVKGKPFNMWVQGVSEGGITDGIQVIDNDKSDNYIQICGTINSSGLYEVVIVGDKYVFNVVEEPDSSNISAILH